MMRASSVLPMAKRPPCVSRAPPPRRCRLSNAVFCRRNYIPHQGAAGPPLCGEMPRPGFFATPHVCAMNGRDSCGEGLVVPTCSGHSNGSTSSTSVTYALCRLNFIRSQPWFEVDEQKDQAFAANEVFEGIATFEDHARRPLAFRTTLLSSATETRVRMAIRPAVKSNGGGGGLKRPHPDGSHCPESTSGRGQAAALLLRVESAGHALQGRLVHSHIRRLCDNLSTADASNQPRHMTPSIRMRLAALDMVLAPLPGLSFTQGATQLRRLLGLMETELSTGASAAHRPRLVDGDATLAVPARTDASMAADGRFSATSKAVGEEDLGGAQLHATLDDAAAADVGQRAASWLDFLRTARELSSGLEKRSAAASSAATALSANGTLPSSQARLAELICSMPALLSGAWPRTIAVTSAVDDGGAGVSFLANDAEARFIRHAMCALGVSATRASSTPAAPRVEAEAQRDRAPPHVLDENDRLREALRRALTAAVAGDMIPRRAPPFS